jgi:hypothetical protein
MAMPTRRTLLTALAIGYSLTLAEGAQTAKNATGLPTYPRDSGGTMDSEYRSVPTGQHCIHYASSTPDTLALVEDWYKKALPSARTDDVNRNSIYGGYFKLDGIKLVIGNDFLTIYRTSNATRTSIEIFKCNDAPHP